MASKRTAAQVEWVPGEDGEPRLTAAPVAYTSSVLPQRWPGGEPRFPVDTAFYLAVQRAELAHLAHHSKAFRDLVGDGEPPPELGSDILAIASDVRRHAECMERYHDLWGQDGLLGLAYDPHGWLDSYAAIFELLGMLKWQPSDLNHCSIEFARRASTPAMLLKYDVTLRRAPDLEIDFGLIPPKTRPEPEAAAPPEAPAGGPEPTEATEATEGAPGKPRKPRNQGKGDRCLGAYTARVAAGGEPPTPTELAKMVGCDKATASRAIKDLEDQRKAFAREDAASRYRDYVDDEDDEDVA